METRREYRAQRWLPTAWPHQDRLAVVAVAAATALFAYGTVVHVVHAAQSVRGADPYLGLPVSVTAFFWLLLVLDPIVVALLLHWPRIGWMLGCVILVVDAVVNAIVNYPPHDLTPGVTAGRVGQVIVSVASAAMLCATLRVSRALRR